MGSVDLVYFLLVHLLPPVLQLNWTIISSMKLGSLQISCLWKHTFVKEIALNSTFFHISKHPFRVNEWSFFHFGFFNSLSLKVTTFGDFYSVLPIFFHKTHSFLYYVLQILTPILHSLLDSKLPETRVSGDKGMNNFLLFSFDEENELLVQCNVVTPWEERNKDFNFIFFMCLHWEVEYTVLVSSK